MPVVRLAAASMRPLAVPATLAQAGVELWRVTVPLEREPDHAQLATLDGPERLRVGAYRQRADRARFAAVRGALRRLLGVRLGVSPAMVPLGTDAHGKPALRLPGPELVFNVSHSGDAGLIAIARAGHIAQIGVDIERCRPVDALALAATAFSPAECAWLDACDDDERLDRFYALWTAREALAKATGLGIVEPAWREAVFVSCRCGAWHVRMPQGNLPAVRDHGELAQADAATVLSLPLDPDQPYRAALAVVRRRTHATDLPTSAPAFAPTFSSMAPDARLA
jgi:4'-phosphopantetheinyl transferase